MRNPSLYIAPSKLGGRGVFTGVHIKKGELIEICPVIILKDGESKLLDATTLYDYYFFWGEGEKQSCIALGYGSLYNHNAPSNADYLMDYGTTSIEVFAVRNIDIGDEITINYNGDPNDKTPPWFLMDGKKR